MSTHTPGPWHLSGSGQYVRKNDKAGWPAWNVAEMNTASEAWEADARLIAAAPELLSTLAGCADALHECAKMLRQLECPGHAAVADIHQEAARAAIAKAKGE
jgi:hypothetical protein